MYILSRISVLSNILMFFKHICVFQTYQCFIRNSHVSSRLQVFYQKHQCYISFVKNMIFWDIDVLSNIVMFYQTYKGFNKNIDVLLRIPLFNQKYQGFITNIHVLTNIFMCYQKYHVHFNIVRCIFIYLYIFVNFIYFWYRLQYSQQILPRGRVSSTSAASAGDCCANPL